MWDHPCDFVTHRGLFSSISQSCTRANAAQHTREPELLLPTTGLRLPETGRGSEMGTDGSAGVAARQAKESLELAFQMSQILDTGLDRHTLSLLMALCDRGANPEALAALVRELSSSAPPTAAPAPSSNGAAAPTPTPTAASLFPSAFRQP
uniref:Uncharacterized protein n=1 Tax=Avena sativa TaxID=4498 RepID=A0ACD5XE23_AVESA